jgi:pimeloyl-ACP methyl ester carboxylesterase
MRVAVEGTGPLVLLLHGFPESWYSWRNQIPALAAAGYRVVAPDMRGYGGTDAPADVADYDLAHLCADVTGLIDHFGEQQALLVGHDWGAAVAWNCVTLAPERFRAVAGLSVPTGPRAPRPYSELLRESYGENFFYMLYFQEPGVAEAELDADPRAVLQRVYASPDTPREPPEVTDPKASAGGWLGRIGRPTELPPWMSQEDLDYYVAQFEGKGFRGGLNYYRQFERNFELTREVDATIPIPALFVAGALDGVIRGQSAEQLTAAMSPVAPDLRGVHVLEGAGHWIQQERADEVNRLLVEFFRGVE